IDLRLCNKRVLEALIDAGACDSLGGHRAQLVAAVDAAFGEAQTRQGERESGQVALFGEHAQLPAPRALLPEVAPWSEHDRLTREKAVLGFFISGHPLARYRVEVELFGTRTTATLGQWSDQRVRIGAVVTVLKRQISKKTGAEYARLTLEDFHGTAEALVFPEAWAKLNEVIRTDRALLLAGSYSGRDRDEEQAPFIVETAQALDELKASGAIGIALRWSPGAPQPPASRRRGGRPRRGVARPARPRPRAPGSNDLTMATHTLDFERPLLELERQIEELKRVASETAVDVTKELAPLEKRLAELRDE